MRTRNMLEYPLQITIYKVEIKIIRHSVTGGADNFDGDDSR